MTIAEVVLASASAARARLLGEAGVRFDVVASNVDEPAVKTALLAQGARPREIADALAELKATRVSGRRPGLVIGADQTLDFGGVLFDKPVDAAAARAQLVALRGGVHALHSALVVAVDGRPIWREVVTAKLAMRSFSDAFLDGYLAQEGEAVTASVGGYRIEGLGIQLFARIEGDTPTVMGLPLLGLLDLLRRHGVLCA